MATGTDLTAYCSSQRADAAESGGARLQAAMAATYMIGYRLAMIMAGAGVLWLAHAGPLTAFGNTVAASYLRLVPDQEAPTRICWGHRNRSSLIRVPLLRQCAKPKRQ